MMVTFEVFLNIFSSKMCQCAFSPAKPLEYIRLPIWVREEGVSEPFVCVELLLRLLVNLAAIAHYLYIYVFHLAYYAYSHN